jgi:hypothetical protein
MFRTRTTAVVALLLLGLADLTSAQAVTPNTEFVTVGSAAVPASNALYAFNAELRRATQPTHWVRGGLIGAGIGAAALMVVGAAVICPLSDEGCDAGNYAAGALLGGGLGFLVGALVGGQFPKQD